MGARLFPQRMLWTCSQILSALHLWIKALPRGVCTARDRLPPGIEGLQAGPARGEAPRDGRALPRGGSVLQELLSAPRFLGSVQSSAGPLGLPSSSRWGRGLVLAAEGFQQGAKALFCLSPRAEFGLQREKKPKPKRSKRHKG